MPYVPNKTYRRMLEGQPVMVPTELDERNFIAKTLIEKRIELAKVQGYEEGLRFALETMADEK